MAKKKVPPPATRTQAAKKPLRKGLISKPVKRSTTKKKSKEAIPAKEKKKTTAKQPSFASYQYPKGKKPAKKVETAQDVKVSRIKSEAAVSKVRRKEKEDLPTPIPEDLPKKREPPKLCIHCNKTLQQHAGFSRCEGGETQFTEKPVVKLPAAGSREAVEAVNVFGFIRVVCEGMAETHAFTKIQIDEFASECNKSHSSEEARAIAERYVVLV